MELNELRMLQALPLDVKIMKSKQRIEEWYRYFDGKVYVSFSGGKDSTVLLHLVRSIYPETKALFVNTGLEYPEVLQFIRSIENVTWVKPEMRFKETTEKFGYPVVSKKVSRMLYDIQNPKEANEASRTLYLTGVKQDGTQTKYFKLPNKHRYLINAPFKISNKCCDIMKKNPIHKFERETGLKAFIGTMASDSMQRESSYLKTGCNSFKGNKSTPLGFWTEKDIWDYIRLNNLEYSKIYDTGVSRTGCFACCYGLELENRQGFNRFTLMKESHPKIYKHCMEYLGIAKVLDYMQIDYGAQITIDETIKEAK